jgi:hypothetical protein
MKGEKPSYEKILAAKKDHYGATTAAYEFAAEEYAKQFVEYHKIKAILLIHGNMTYEDFNALKEALGEDYYVFSQYKQQDCLTFEIVSQEEATQAQKEAIQQIIDNQGKPPVKITKNE